MANAKKIIAPWSETGLTVYCIVRRETDGYRLDDADGTFAASPADPYLSLTEDSIIKGLYEVSESRTAWTDGRHTVTVYRQAGASPVPASDQVIGSGEMWIVSDSEVALDDPANFKADVSNVTVGTNLDKTGYDLNADQRAVVVGRVEVLTAHTPQTGDNFPLTSKLTFIEKWILNKLVESPTGTFTLYDDDGTTVLKTWTVSGTARGAAT